MASVAPRRDLIRRASSLWKRPAILAGYGGRGRVARLSLLWYLLFVAAVGFYGFVFAIYGRYYLVPILAPLALLAGLALWTLPRTENPPVRWLEGLFWAFMLLHLTWPDYLALAIPGVPWISAIRLTTTPLSLILLVCLSVSRGFRQHMLDVMSSARSVMVLMGIFLLTGLVTIPMSADVGFSANKFITAQFTWTAVFFAAIYVFSLPRRPTQLLYLIWAITIPICLIAAWEAHYQMVPWRDHIPSFLKIEDPRIAKLLSGIERAGSGIYRTQSRFSGSINLGEYLALITPLLLHLIATARRTWVRWAVILTMPLLLWADIVTASRSAMIGLAISLVLYGVFWAYLNWRRSPGSVFATGMLAAFPTAAAAFGIVALSFPRVRKIFLGGGAEAASTDVRRIMYEMGIPKILHNPIGHGMGRGGVTLGYYAPDGSMTIDTYYIAVALEYGIVGFVTYFGAFLIAIFLGLRLGLRTRDRETELAGAVAIALINFVIIKSVFSQQENHSLVFALLGLMVALLWRGRQEAAADEAANLRPSVSVAGGGRRLGLAGWGARRGD